MGVTATLAGTRALTGSDIVNGVLGGILSLAVSPGGVVLLVLVLVLLSLARRLRGVAAHKDPERGFSRAQKAEILRRAGGRCEHHHPLYGRCPERSVLEADHVHPHSRGGWTNVANGQALCRRHNKAKWASVPTNGELRRLARRRGSYFPPGILVQVIRRAPKGTYIPLPPPPPLATLMEAPGPGAPARVAPALWTSAQPVDESEVRRFDPPRPVEVLVDGAWRPGLQQGWRREGHAWTAEVSWFGGYSTDGGRQIATIPADRVRLPAPPQSSSATTR